MNNIIDFIQEKLRIDKNVQAKKEYSDEEINELLSKYKRTDIPGRLIMDINYKSPADEWNQIKKIKYYHEKGSKPERLVSSIKNREKLIKRWVACMADDWEEAAEVFKDEIVKRGYYTDEELFIFVLIYKVKYIPEKYKKFLW